MKVTQSAISIVPLVLVLFFCCPSVGIAQTIDVWIDPGHGDFDPGNLGISNDPAKYEKNIALQAATCFTHVWVKWGLAPCSRALATFSSRWSSGRRLLRERDRTATACGRSPLCQHE